VDEVGKIVREVKVASEPDALLAVLRNATYRFKRIGLEAGPLSQWLFSALAEADSANSELMHRSISSLFDHPVGHSKPPPRWLAQTFLLKASWMKLGRPHFL
jgi:hypothetical protein